jgi:hypothetical protein
MPQNPIAPSISFASYFVHKLRALSGVPTSCHPLHGPCMPAAQPVVVCVYMYTHLHKHGAQTVPTLRARSTLLGVQGSRTSSHHTLSRCVNLVSSHSAPLRPTCRSSNSNRLDVTTSNTTQTRAQAAADHRSDPRRRKNATLRISRLHLLR